MMKRYIIGICVCLAVTLASAQTRREMGGIYYAYPNVDVKEMRQTPSGYKPFYISHYGRHGSRWMTLTSGISRWHNIAMTNQTSLLWD